MPCNCGKRRSVDTRTATSGLRFEVVLEDGSTRSFITRAAAERYATKYHGEIRAISTGT
jgi:hypothetical protein